MLMLSYLVIDAFSDQPLRGNPAAVVFGGDALDPADMQRIAQEINLSETVFVLPADRPEADYRVRIFTPRSELPFAGHPTLATAHAMLLRGGLRGPQLTQSCALGLIPLTVQAKGPERWFIEMTQGVPSVVVPALDRQLLADALGCAADVLTARPPAVVSTGVPWLLAELDGPAALEALAPDPHRLAPLCQGLGALGVTLFCALPSGQDAAYRLRTFAPGEGIGEDPVCGSGHGAVCAYLAQGSGQPEGAYEAEQGVELGRRGKVWARWTTPAGGIAVHIGGTASVFAEGTLVLR
jgi:PhzF family phenazine biosynthesis protein